jgi:hypothetical protein
MPSSKPKKIGFARLPKAKQLEISSRGGKATAKKLKAAKKAAAAKPAKTAAKRK